MSLTVLLGIAAMLLVILDMVMNRTATLLHVAVLLLAIALAAGFFA